MNENAMNETVNTCAECGCVGEELFELWINGEYKLVCADCAEANGYYRCEDCGEWVHEDDMLVVNSGIRWATQHYVCSDCAERSYYKCDDCGDYFTEQNVRRDDYGNCICDNCYDRGDYITCDDCGIITSDYEWNEHDDCYYCSSCAGDHRHSGGLNDYSYKPSPEFQFRTGERTLAQRAGVSTLDSYLTFGLELEVDDGDDADELCDNLGDLGLPIYMKHDGSLHSEGVEIVSHPGSLAWHCYDMRWAEVIRQCKALNYKSHDTTTCGLHIHVGRRGMGSDGSSRDTAAANLVVLVNALWANLVTFTRRTEGALNNWAARPTLRDYITERDADWNIIHRTLDLDNDADLKVSALKTRDSGRYQAVNLTNTHTVEFRLFRGTLKRDTLIAAIQLVSNLTKYAMTHTPTECKRAKWSDIIAVEQFKELNAYCQAKGLN